MTRQASATGAGRTWHSARPIFRWAPLGLAAALLVGCGGGDDDNGTPPPSAGAFSIGGAVSGLGAGKTVTLQNAGKDDLTVNTNGNFVFVTRLDNGIAYAVTVKTQPSGQRCTVTEGTGTATANVSNVQVRCENLAAATYTVGGSVSGLAGGAVVLQNNGRDDLSVSSNGGFTFGTALAGGTAYAITVRTQPSGQSCTVRNGTGTVGSANVSSVDVSCATAALGLPEGDWKQELCVVVRPGTWGRSLWRITRQSDTRVVGQIGVVTYADANCSGTGTVAGPLTDVGNVAFDRNGSTATLTAFWGLWTQPSGLTSRAVWARKGPRLCIFGDQIPTAFPTAASVESYVDTVLPAKTCYTQN
ncbi:hypothetical protein ATF69_0322 [Acidovorax delafieldii]|uniref:Uncharacterized protein n=1 Tax=Acidovorax delafieldii TaxID=47920 RepID=A0A561XXI3_ACIDE|nr:hypothetical protein [Acidovorax delafieldii]TWG40817.1 hypothetical protein ATF69_0322 [Acidovorax delafieldii]